MRGRPFTALGAGLVLALAAGAARGDELAWKLEGATLRYDLTVEKPAPEPSPAPAFCPLVLLAQPDFRDGRTPLRAVEDVGDLVWHYAMALPDSVDEKGGEATFEAQHTLPGNPGPVLRVRGVHASRLRGRKATIRTTITFSPEPATFWAKAGQLVVERTFAARDGRLEGATFTLDLDVQAGDPLVTTHGTWKGVIAAKDELRVDDRSFHQQVQQAIDKGAAWLKRASNDRLGAFKGAPTQGHQSLGEIALPAFALLRSGVPVSEVEHLFEWMHRQPFKATYSVSLYLMALEARSVQRVSLAAQSRTRSVARYNRQPPPAADVELMKQALKWLVASRKLKEGWWSYGGRHVEAGTQERREGPLPVGPLGHDLVAAATGGDRSNSQFAILALHSAMAAGLEVEGAVWEELLAELTGAQQETGPPVDLTPSVYGGNSPLAYDPRDAASGTTSERPQGGLPPTERASALARGWGYHMKSRTGANDAYGSMTAAGLSSVAVVREGLLETRHLTGERDRAALLSMRDGIAWFALNYDPARNTGRNTAWYYYYLYSVEKAMDLCGLERVGPHEWWREGAAELLVRQQPNGSWGDANDTALALLFLNRATLPAKLDIEAARRVATGEGPDPTAWDKVNVQGTGVVSLRQVLGALLNAGPREALQHLPLAQSAWAAFDEDQRPRLLPELVQLLDASHRAVKKWAKDTCVEVAGSDDPTAIAAFSRRWEELRRAWETEDRTKIALAQAILVEVDAPVPLKRAALVAVARLGACETLGEVIALLDHRDAGLRAFAGQTLLAIAGPRREYDAAAAPAERKKQVDAWRAWWTQDGPALVTAERIRRAVADLGVEAKAAAAATDLRAIGKPAVRALIDGLRHESSKARAHALLQELTRQKLPADVGVWLEWWEKENPQGS
jgi:hypothetical protein